MLELLTVGDKQDGSMEVGYIAAEYLYRFPVEMTVGYISAEHLVRTPTEMAVGYISAEYLYRIT